MVYISSHSRAYPSAEHKMRKMAWAHMRGKCEHLYYLHFITQMY